MIDDVARELTAMAEEDRRVRAELAADGSLFDGYHPRMRAVHDHNAARLTEIIGRMGWPTSARVGREASSSAWLIAQHAIAHPRLQRRVLALLKELLGSDDVDPIEVAMLEDRILTFEGRPQLYGTQFDFDEHGEISPLPYDDAQRVDQRRAQVGLPPLAQTVAEKRRMMQLNGEKPPAHRDDYLRRLQEFLHEVGWR